MTPRERAEKIAILIGREVAELPDRTSPPDEPTLLLVTEQELREILEPHLERAITDHIASLAAERDVEELARKIAKFWRIQYPAPKKILSITDADIRALAIRVLALQAAELSAANARLAEIARIAEAEWQTDRRTNIILPAKAACRIHALATGKEKPNG